MGAAMSPLAVVICFGLLYGTTLILLVIPAVLSIIETLQQRRAARKPQPATDVATVHDGGPDYAFDQ